MTPEQKDQKQAQEILEAFRPLKAMANLHEERKRDFWNHIEKRWHQTEDLKEELPDNVIKFPKGKK